LGRHQSGYRNFRKMAMPNGPVLPYASTSISRQDVERKRREGSDRRGPRARHAREGRLPGYVSLEYEEDDPTPACRAWRADLLRGVRKYSPEGRVLLLNPWPRESSHPRILHFFRHDERFPVLPRHQPGGFGVAVTVMSPDRSSRSARHGKKCSQVHQHRGRGADFNLRVQALALAAAHGVGEVEEVVAPSRTLRSRRLLLSKKMSCSPRRSRPGSPSIRRTSFRRW